MSNDKFITKSYLIKQLKNFLSNVVMDKFVNKKTELVVFGDSWTDVEATPYAIWAQTVATHTGLNLHNYAINGADFTAQNEFGQELTAYRNDDSYDKKDVACVIWLGGINDYHANATAATLATKLKEFIVAVRAEGIGDQVPFHCFFNWSFLNQGKDFFIPQWRYFTAVRKNLANEINAQFHTTFSWYSYNDWNQDPGNWFHLTADAHKNVLAKNVIASIWGGDIVRGVVYRYTGKIENASDPESAFTPEGAPDKLPVDLQIEVTEDGHMKTRIGVLETTARKCGTFFGYFNVSDPDWVPGSTPGFVEGSTFCTFGPLPHELPFVPTGSGDIQDQNIIIGGKYCCRIGGGLGDQNATHFFLGCVHSGQVTIGGEKYVVTDRLSPYGDHNSNSADPKEMIYGEYEFVPN